MIDFSKYFNRRIAVIFIRTVPVNDLMTGEYLRDYSRKTRKTINTPSLLDACRKIKKAESKRGTKSIKFVGAYLFTGPRPYDWNCLSYHHGKAVGDR